MSVFIFLAAAALARSSPLPAQSAASASNASVAALPPRDAEMQNYIRALERQQDSRDIESRVQGGLTSWFEILLSVLVGFFSLVVTVAVIFLALRTKDAAVAEARSSVEDIRRDLQKILDETRQLTDKHIEQMLTVESESASILSKLRFGETPKNPEDRQTVADAAKMAESKLPSNRTADDLRSLISASQMARDWQGMRDHSRALLYLFGSDEKAAAGGLFHLAYAMHEQKRTEEALRAIQELLDRFGDSSDPEIQKYIPPASFNCGLYLDALKHSEQAIETYSALVSRFGESTDDLVLEQVAKALVNKGFQLGLLGKSKDAVEIYEDVISRFGNSDRPLLQEQSAKAMFNKGVRIGILGDLGGEIAAYSESISKYDDSENERILETLAGALFNRGIALDAIGRSNDALIDFDEVIERFKRTDNPYLHEQVTKSLFAKARLAAKAKDVTEAIANLRKWAESKKGFDHNAVAKNADFKGVRETSDFISFLREMDSAQKPSGRRKPKGR